GECRVVIDCSVDLFDHEFHPARADCAHINLLTVHPIGEFQFLPGAVGKLSANRREPMILIPDRGALKVARLPKNAMEGNLTIKVEANPLADAGAVRAFNPSRRALSVDCIRSVVRVGLYREPN